MADQDREGTGDDTASGWTVGFEHPGALPPQDAVIFDLDGVVTDTTALQARPGKRLFDEVIVGRR